jgi:type III secretion protein J
MIELCNTLDIKKLFHRTARTLMAVIAVMIIAGCDSPKTIVNDIEEKEANEIIVFLASKGIEADKAQAEEGGAGSKGATLYYIIVETSRATEAMAILNKHGLPRRKGPTLLGLFTSQGLVPSEMQEQIRYLSGLEEELANTIRKIDGIIDAEVQLSIPEKDTLDPGFVPEDARASVYVKHIGVLDDPNSHLITKIKRWISSSVKGLAFDNVTVIADRARFVDVILEGVTKGSIANRDTKDYVSIWSIIIAKESAGRFRVIFFTLILLLFLTALALSWVAWKIHLLFTPLGGVKGFLSPVPFSTDTLAPAPKEEDEEEKDEGEEDDDEEEEDDFDEEEDGFDEEELEDDEF